MNTINHPAHYQGCSDLTRDIAVQFVTEHHLDLECIEVIEKFKLSFHVGNALKYVWRAGQKSDPVEDLLKAKWYLERYQAIHGALWGITICMIDKKIAEIQGGGL